MAGTFLKRQLDSPLRSSPKKGDMEKSGKTGYDICLKIVVFSPVNWFLHLSDSFLAILGPCLSLSSKLLGLYNLTARLAIISSKRSVKTGPEFIDTLTKKFALEDEYQYMDV